LEDDVEPPEEEEEDEFEELGEDDVHTEEEEAKTDALNDPASQQGGVMNSASLLQTIEPSNDMDDDFTHLISHVSLGDSSPTDPFNGNNDPNQLRDPPSTAQPTSTATPIRSNPISIPISSSSRTPSMVRTSSTRSTNRSNTATDTDGENAQPSTFVAREGLSLGSSPGMMGAGVLDIGPMTPRNDVGPWVFDGSSVGNSGSLVGRAVGGETGEEERAVGTT
jgi:hypothetical protein